MPAHLTGEAKREWERITPQLYKLGLLSPVDVAAIAVYCDAWSDYVAATRRSRQPVLKTDKGVTYINPHYKVKRTAVQHLHKMLIEFGLSPACRTKIHAIPPAAGEEVNPFAEIAG